MSFTVFMLILAVKLVINLVVRALSDGMYLMEKLVLVPTTLNLDMDHVKRARAQVGSHGLSRLMRQLMAQWLQDQGALE